MQRAAMKPWPRSQAARKARTRAKTKRKSNATTATRPDTISPSAGLKAAARKAKDRGRARARRTMPLRLRRNQKRPRHGPRSRISKSQSLWPTPKTPRPPWDAPNRNHLKGAHELRASSTTPERRATCPPSASTLPITARSHRVQSPLQISESSTQLALGTSGSRSPMASLPLLSLLKMFYMPRTWGSQ